MFIYTETIVPPNVTVNRVRRDNATVMQIRWGPPLHPVRGYFILYRKFDWFYRGRWQVKEINDPTALSSEVIANDPGRSYIVVVRGKAVRSKSSLFEQPYQI